MRLLLGLLLSLLLPLIALCAEDYYKVLGISKSASDREIKKAYKAKSLQYHPDKNPGDESANTKFLEVTEAYEILHDKELRGIYDRGGHTAVERHKQGGQQHGHNPFDVFSQFFGGGGRFGGERRGPNVEIKVAVPLRDFYNGRDTQFTVEKQAICEKCEGTGSADGQVDTCSTCGGRGIRIQKHQLAPGIYQQVQMQCDVCHGRGKTIKHPCPVCGGRKVVREQETHDLHVERGMPHGVRITYENEADASPDWVAGDMLVYLVEQEPQLGKEDDERTDGTFFRRRGKDLFWREVLSLREAWMGDWTRNITHLDGHVVQLSRKKGEVIQPGTVEIVQGEGMPIWHGEHSEGAYDMEFGSLHVEYVVVLPDQMDKSMEKEFWGLWEKWRKKKGVDLHKDSGRPDPKDHDEL
ncbi:DnaJ-domain-containing protein [Patellaria atrata CBS 101060]|uniref:DnaJ-domain-containing protein n=1 Tax=Patellaria atrata CBS 101060 TaxID=1346257 RepID=A0A9P4S2R0_9PEZI|nr:DnaJ-domain-containing protein [Patellaria atrata CBS 101060]